MFTVVCVVCYLSGKTLLSQLQPQHSLAPHANVHMNYKNPSKCLSFWMYTSNHLHCQVFVNQQQPGMRRNFVIHQEHEHTLEIRLSVWLFL